VFSLSKCRRIDVERFMNKIDQLLPWQQICYGAAMVARMSQNYELFCEVSGQGDTRSFKDILQLVWEYAGGQNNQIDFSKQQDKLEIAVPDPDQFEGFGVWPALDATTALSALLSACNKSDIEELCSIATLSRSTIANYLQVCGEDGSIEQHPLMREDLAFTDAVVEQLLQHKGARKSAVASVKAMAYALESSNIGVSISQ
jgi:uncharacterized protein